MQAKQYDYIFLGIGCSSLSIVMRMIASAKFTGKKILLIDKDEKNKNDRTWCFWEKGKGFFEEVVYKKWDHLSFTTEDENISLDISPYQYKMIRGIDFYKHCLLVINAQENIDIAKGIISFDEKNNVLLNGEALVIDSNAFIFNSIYQPAKRQKEKFYLLQHFKGWIIESSKDYFDTDKAVLMDFRVSQDHGTTFVYVLPLSTTRALVEYTLFSEEILLQQEYDTALKIYINNFLGLDNYKISDEEFGVIPMTNAKFPSRANNMYYIGTAGGSTKASTGYTFRFIQKQADSIVEELIGKKKVLKWNKPNSRFHFYDSTLLHILSEKLLEGKTIFSILFKKNRGAVVLKFLDNETTFPEELKLLNSLPKKVFLKAGTKELIKMLTWNSKTKD